jgi:hypothetical protein
LENDEGTGENAPVSNVWLTERTITVTGALDSEASIGVTMVAWDEEEDDYVPHLGVFAQAYEDEENAANTYNEGKLTADDVECFTSDNDGYTVILNSDGRAELVRRVAATGVTLNTNTLSLTIGGSETLTATVAPGNATDKIVTWSSDNTAVATVDGSGKVTAVAPGTATITVTTADGGFSATCAVTVYGVKGVWKSGKLTANVAVSDPAKTLLLAAVYDAGGRQVSVKVISLEAGKTEYATGLSKQNGYTYKLMLVNKTTFAPLFAAWSEK